MGFCDERKKESGFISKLLRSYVMECTARHRLKTLVCVQREYHALTKSYYPYTWPEVLRHTIASQIQTLALMILRLYRTKSTGLSGYNLKSGAVELAYIISQGLTMNNAVIFDRNYFMLSALPPLENTRSTIRNKIMNFIRTSPGWNTIRSIC